MFPELPPMKEYNKVHGAEPEAQKLIEEVVKTFETVNTDVETKRNLFRDERPDEFVAAEEEKRQKREKRKERKQARLAAEGTEEGGEEATTTTTPAPSQSKKKKVADVVTGVKIEPDPHAVLGAMEAAPPPTRKRTRKAKVATMIDDLRRELFMMTDEQRVRVVELLQTKESVEKIETLLGDIHAE